MCRNIKTLHNFEPPATDDEVYAAALQYIRKVSGSTKPSKANEAVFMRAVDEIAHITNHLLEDLVTAAPPREPCFDCDVDAYEPDDRCASSERSIRQGETQVHSFCDDGDDWLGGGVHGA